MIIGFKVTQSCAEPRIVQEWNLIIDRSPEKLNITLLWSYGSSHLQKHFSFQPLIPLRVLLVFFYPKLCLLAEITLPLLCVALADWNIRVISICDYSCLCKHIHPIAHLRFPIYWLTLGRKFSEGALVITCPTSTDFQNYNFFPLPKITS